MGRVSKGARAQGHRRLDAARQVGRSVLTENVVAELGVLQAEGLELGLGLGAKGVGAAGPEVRDGGADGGVGLGGVRVDVLGVRDLALGGGVDAVNLGAGEGAQGGHAELVGQRVHARVLEQLDAVLIDLGEGRVRLERARAGQLLGEVLARVQELEEAADGLDVLFGELDLAGLGGGQV